MSETDRMRREIDRLQEHYDYAVKKNGEQWAEIKRLQTIKDRLNAECDIHAAEIMRLHEALAKSCEEGRDEMYDCGYNRLQAKLEQIDNHITNRVRDKDAEIERLWAVLEQIANLRPGYRFPDARDIAREALL